MGALCVSALLYLALHVACASAVPRLAQVDAPLVAAGEALGGPTLGKLVSIGTTVSVVGIAFGMFAMTPRYLFALNAKDALGNWAGSADARGVPRRALFITAVLVLTLASFGALNGLFVLSSLAVLAQYGVSLLALTRLSLRGSSGLSLRHLWPAPLGLLAIVLIARAAKLEELWVMVGILVSGAALFASRRYLSLRELS
jgi:amino acid transporter